MPAKIERIDVPALGEIGDDAGERLPARRSPVDQHQRDPGCRLVGIVDRDSSGIEGVLLYHDCLLTCTGHTKHRTVQLVHYSGPQSDVWCRAERWARARIA